MDETLFLGMAGGAISVAIIALAIFYVLLIIANWRIFNKAGEGGWKSLIPIYNTYIYFKISWKPSMFWTYVLVSIATYFLAVSENVVLLYIAVVLAVFLLFISIISLIKFSRAFGHGIVFAIGLLLIPNIMTLILAFGGSKYYGPQR